MPSFQVVLDQADIAFDDDHPVAGAGVLPATLAERLGVEQVTDQVVDLGGPPGPQAAGADDFLVGTFRAYPCKNAC